MIAMQQSAVVSRLHACRFQCPRCALATTVELPILAEGFADTLVCFGEARALRVAEERAEAAANQLVHRRRALLRCPSCGWRAFPFRLAVRAALVAAVVAVPGSLVALVLAFLPLRSHAADLGVGPPFALAGLITAGIVLGVFRQVWRSEQNAVAPATEFLGLARWTLPDGPRIVAIADPLTDAKAVWVDGRRTALPPGAVEHVLPRPAPFGADGPYRAGGHLTLVTFAPGSAPTLVVAGVVVPPDDAPPPHFAVPPALAAPPT